VTTYESIGNSVNPPQDGYTIPAPDGVFRTELVTARNNNPSDTTKINVAVNGEKYEVLRLFFTARAVLMHGHAGALDQGPHEIRAPMLIYVCCDLLSINNYYAILNYK